MKYDVPRDKNGVKLEVGDRVEDVNDAWPHRTRYGTILLVYEDCAGVIDCRVLWDEAAEYTPIHGSAVRRLPPPNRLIRTLARIGLVTVRSNRTVRWPFYVAPRWMWGPLWRLEPVFGLFRNRPDVMKWIPGRLLPLRWGFRCWIFEVGDRGSAQWSRRDQRLVI